MDFNKELNKQMERQYGEDIRRAVEALPTNAGNKEIKLDLDDLIATKGEMGKLKNLLAEKLTAAGMEEFKKATIKGIVKGNR